MKQILLAAAMLLSFGFKAQAQATTAYNNTGCNIEVIIHCYDAICGWVSSSAPISVPFGGAPVALTPPCNPGDFTVFEVCWGFVPGCGFPTMCDFVDGNPGGPSACGPGTYTAQIQSCDVCNNGNNGIGFITYDDVNNELRIDP